jgi:hypothetical protein
MNTADIKTMVEQRGKSLAQVADEKLTAWLQPVREQQQVIQFMEMSPLDHRAVELAKGNAEYRRFTEHMTALKEKHHAVLGR